ETRQVFLIPADSAGMWDANGKAKQPFMLRNENGNLYEGKVGPWMDPQLRRKVAIWQSLEDSIRFAWQFDPERWASGSGRASTSTLRSSGQPVSRGYGVYPYVREPGDVARFSLAEVVGYGPGVAGDEVYTDLGGAVRAGVDAGALFSPVPSWYERIEYPHVGDAGFMGSTYLQDHPLPWYVTAPVVSIRDVADRAIEMYTGRPLVKHDTLQYDPPSAPSTGRYNTVPIPFPA